MGSQQNQMSSGAVRLVQPPVPELLIRNWPVVDEWPTRLVVVSTILLVWTLATMLSQSWAMGALAALSVAVSLCTFWLPVYFRFQPRGIERTVLGRHELIPWRAVRAYHVRRRGVALRCRFDERLIRNRWYIIQWHDQRREVLEAMEVFGPRLAQRSGPDPGRSS